MATGETGGRRPVPQAVHHVRRARHRVLRDAAVGEVLMPGANWGQCSVCGASYAWKVVDNGHKNCPGPPKKEEPKKEPKKK